MATAVAASVTGNGPSGEPFRPIREKPPRPGLTWTSSLTGNTSSTRTVIMLADLRASLRAVTAYMLALFAVAALPGYLLAAVGN
jgi:hypothetical protein